MSGEFDDVSSDEFRNALDNSAENATFNRIKNMKIADRIDALSKLKVQKPEEYEKLKAKKYKEEGNERMAEVYTNCAKYHRRDANDLFEILDALGEYDNL